MRKYILRVFLAFAEQAFELVRQGLWTVDRADKESREFLWDFAREAVRGKGHDQWGRPIGSRMVKELDLSESNHGCGLNALSLRKHPKGT